MLKESDILELLISFVVGEFLHQIVELLCAIKILFASL